MLFKKEIVLENDRVRLEPLGAEHLSDLTSIAEKHPNLLQFSPSAFGSQESIRLYIVSAEKARMDKKRIAFAIFDKKQKRFVGSTSLGNISIYDKRLEIGWTWLDKDVQGTGLNKECKYLLLQFVFETLEFKRVELKTDARNSQSRKAIEKIGGVYEGTLRSHTLMQDDHRRDTVYYGILQEDWTDLKRDIFFEVP